MDEIDAEPQFASGESSEHRLSKCHWTDDDFSLSADWPEVDGGA